MPSTDSELWTFSLTLYRQEGVEPALLSLQDEDGLDVNLILFALWSACRGLRLDATTLARIDGLIGAWQRDVVAELRKLRKNLKPSAQTDSLIAGLRNRIKKLEIEAERIEQLRLEAFASERAAISSGHLSAAVEGNLEQLCKGLSKRPQGVLLRDRTLSLERARSSRP